MNKKPMNDNPTFEDAMKGDSMLYQLAAYDVCKGMIIIPKDMDEIMSLQKKVADRFNYFKRLIVNKEITFDELNRSVAIKNGPFYNADRNLSEEEMVEKIIAQSQKKEEEVKDETPQAALLKVFKDMIQMTGGNVDLRLMEEKQQLPEGQIDNQEKLLNETPKKIRKQNAKKPKNKNSPKS